MTTEQQANPTADQSPDPTLTAASRRAAKRLIWFLGVLYFINYLDRTNISFAGPNGMNQDLGLTQTMFGLASGVFFIGYLLLEVPSNMALHRFGARRWIARIMVSWGIVATAMTWVPNEQWLYTLRFLLGVAEAGFFPGIILFLTYWFPQKDRTRIVALFMLAIPLSSAIGAPVSSWIISTGHGLFGLEGWRTMFLFEGIPAVIFGVICWFYLTDRPRDAHWMPDDERHALVTAMDADEEAKAARYEVSVRDSLTRPRVWALAFVYFGGVYGLYALGFFLPTIIKGFETQYNVSYGIVERGFINAIPYVLGAVAMYVWSRHGDRTRERVWHVALPLIVGGVAIPVTLYLGSPFAGDGRREHLRHRRSWPSCRASGRCRRRSCPGWRRPAGSRLINSVGNLSGFAAPYITGWLADFTGQQRAGLWVVGGTMVAAAVVTLVLRAAPEPTAQQSG